MTRDICHACGMHNGVVAATLASSLQLKALRNLHEVFSPVAELRFAGKFPDASNGGNITDELRRNWRLLISLRSISGGNFTIPNMNKYHRGFTTRNLLKLSDFPTLLTDGFRSMSDSDEVFELETRCNF